MARIKLDTFINAPIEVVFNLSRSVDLHKISAAHTTEEAIEGRTTGLMEPGETVTWQAKHFGIRQELSVVITNFDVPNYFTDEMVPGKGAFAAMMHQHMFYNQDGKTKLTDVFMYKSPLGVLGRLADELFLKRYMRNFLIKRNAIIKEFAEDPEKYKKILL